jgi:NAD+ diphosphatase
VIQDISPRVFHNEYVPRPPRPGDIAFVYDDGKVLLDNRGGSAAFPAVGDFAADFGISGGDGVFLFTVDETAFFLFPAAGLPEKDGYELNGQWIFRGFEPKHLAFAGITACHLAAWYEKHRFCGRCGKPARLDEKERKTYCPDCGVSDYPGISPAVIVGVINGERLLLTHYADRPVYTYALIAGFTEIGETIEDTVRREVMEEVGLRVKNIRFYKSQPWAFSSSLLVGFYCDLDGDDTVTLDGVELAEAVWIPRGEIPPQDTGIALTAEMIEQFVKGLQ